MWLTKRGPLSGPCSSRKQGGRGPSTGLGTRAALSCAPPSSTLGFPLVVSGGRFSLDWQ